MLLPELFKGDPERAVPGINDPASRRNQQNRSIKQIAGHLVDSASNNLHRIIHLQYRESPLDFPDYANLGENDKWIGLQNYQQEDWFQIVQLWKYTNLHLAHTISQIKEETLPNVWISALAERITLEEMVLDYPRHVRLHLQDICDLAEIQHESFIQSACM